MQNATNYKVSQNTAALYADSLIIVDDYFNGKNMMLSLKRYKKLLGKNLTLEVTPLMDSSAIYFEPSLSLGFSKTEHAVLENIESTPVYETVINLNNE